MDLEKKNVQIVFSANQTMQNEPVLNDAMETEGVVDVAMEADHVLDDIVLQNDFFGWCAN